jgi:mono/diheme cytochrome c family protein
VKLLLAALFSAGLAGAACAADMQDTTLLERGRYLVDAGDCAACHTVPGGPDFAGGRKLETPFGNLVSPNLTPDQETGIGGWSDDEFYRAMHDGIGPGGIHLYPGFPYPSFTLATRADVLAIRAWLATLPPVRNAVVSNQLPFPFNVRASLTGWDALYFKRGEYQPDGSKTTEWNRGAYLVRGLGHCGLCHTPKTALGGDENANFVQGSPLQGWYAPNLTNAPREGLGGWSVDDVVAYLRNGANAHALASGPMAEVITLSTSRLTEADLHAVAIYLKDLPAAPANSATPIAADDPRMQRGAALYVDQCAACHTFSGNGASLLFPSLAGGASVQQRGAQSLIRVLLQGTRAAATQNAPTGPAMPGFWWKLNDEQIADVLTYVRNGWGNAASAVGASDVADARARLGAP